MQLTRFDRWLREKFVYEIHIQTLRPPEAIPRGIRAFDLPDIPGKRYKHLFIADSSTLADELIAVLNESSQMYTTQIIDKDRWYVPFIAPKDKSVTWWLVSTIFISSSVILTLLYLKELLLDDHLRKNLLDALKLFKNG
jgi:hypothetical protein